MISVSSIGSNRGKQGFSRKGPRVTRACSINNFDIEKTHSFKPNNLLTKKKTEEKNFNFEDVGDISESKSNPDNISVSEIERKRV
jgi:hypothetical protein